MIFIELIQKKNQKITIYSPYNHHNIKNKSVNFRVYLKKIELLNANIKQSI